jgi:chromosome segregation ATPase
VSALRSGIDDILERTKQLQRKFDEDEVSIFAAHDVSMKVYTMKSEATLERAQTKKRRREEKLAYLKDETKRQHEETKKMREEKQKLKNQVEEWLLVEEEEDEDLVSLNMQIKSVLEKKASLRSSLTEVKEVLRNAVENRDHWERMCVEESE